MFELLIQNLKINEWNEEDIDRNDDIVCVSMSAKRRKFVRKGRSLRHMKESNSEDFAFESLQIFSRLIESLASYRYVPRR